MHLTVRTFHLSFTCKHVMFSPLLDPGGIDVGNQFLIFGLPIIAVAVLAIPTVLATIILLTYFYRKLVFIIIIVIILVIVHMLCLRYIIQFVLPTSCNGVYLFTFMFRRRLRGRQEKVSNLITYNVIWLLYIIIRTTLQYIVEICTQCQLLRQCM